MKKLLFLLLVLSGGYLAAQTDGLNYQAVILDPSIQELPGQDISNNILPNQDIELRFTILNENGTADYQEIPDAGHGPNIEQHEIFEKLLRDFLN